MQNGKTPATQPEFIRFESLPSPIGRVIHAALWRNSSGPLHMRTMDHYCITLTLDGSADYESPISGNHTIRPGDLVMVFPGVPHFYGPTPGKNWTEFFIDFDGPVFDLWTQSGMLDPTHPILHLEPVEYWHRRLRAIVESPIRGGPELVAIRVCQLQNFLAEAIAHHKEKLTGTESTAWLEEAKTMLEQSQADDQNDLQAVADHFAMSYETFRKKFARLAGISPGAYRIHRAIDRAARILIEKRDMPLKQVAVQCGFCNEFYFSKQFKQTVGISPSEFRKRIYGNQGS